MTKVIVHGEGIPQEDIDMAEEIGRQNNVAVVHLGRMSILNEMIAAAGGPAYNGIAGDSCRCPSCNARRAENGADAERDDRIGMPKEVQASNLAGKGILLVEGMEGGGFNLGEDTVGGTFIDAGTAFGPGKDVAGSPLPPNFDIEKLLNGLKNGEKIDRTVKGEDGKDIKATFMKMSLSDFQELSVEEQDKFMGPALQELIELMPTKKKQFNEAYDIAIRLLTELKNLADEGTKGIGTKLKIILLHKALDEAFSVMGISKD
jgi:hypothetical protein